VNTSVRRWALEGTRGIKVEINVKYSKLFHKIKGIDLQSVTDRQTDTE
jgi:hypothetical protein